MIYIIKKIIIKKGGFQVGKKMGKRWVLGLKYGVTILLGVA